MERGGMVGGLVGGWCMYVCIDGDGDGELMV